MPVKNLLRRVELLQAGYDPDKLEEYTPVDQPEVTQQQPTKSSEPQTSATGGFLSHTLAGIPSAGAGLAAGAATAEMLSPAAGIPVIGPAIPVAGGLLSGIITSMLAKKGQDGIVNAVAPQANQYLEQTQTEHPIASGIGEVASSLPFLKPNPSVARSALQTITKPLTGIAPSLANKANLVNAGLGAAVPLASRIYQEGLTSALTDPQTYIEAAGGALMNDPTTLGKSKLIGLHPAILEKPTGQGLDKLHASSPPVEPAKEPLQLTYNEPKQTVKLPDGEGVATVPKGSAPEVKSYTDIDQQFKTSPIADEYLKAKQEKEAEESRIAEETRKLKEQTELLKKINAAPQPEVEGLESAIKNNQLAGPENINRKTNPQRDFTKGMQGEDLLSKPTEAELIQDEYDKGIRHQEVQEQNKSPLERSQAYSDFIQNDLGPKRGVTVENTKKVYDESGREVLGSVNLKERVAKINPNKATLDTDTHELFHQLYSDMQTAGTKQDKALLNRSNRIIEQSPEYHNWRAERQSKGLDSTPHEFLTQLTGEDSVRRLLKTDKNGNIKSWFKDFWAYQKSKLGKATPQYIARIMSNKLVNEPHYNETFGAKTGNVIAPKVSEEKTKNQQADVEYARGTPSGTSTVNPEDGIFGKLNFIKPEIEKVRGIGGSHAENLANAQTRFFDNYTSIKGKLDGVLQEKLRELGGVNPFKSLKGYLEQNSEVLKSTLNKMYQERDGAKPTYTPEESSIKAEVRRVLDTVRNEQNSRPVLPKAGPIDSTYIPHITKWSVIQKILKNRATPEAIKLQRDFITYQTNKLRATGMPAPEAAKQAAENLETVIKGYNKKTVDIASQYGPIDKAEGLGLPPSWREDNMLNAMHRYLDRVSRRFAYADAIEADSNAVKALNVLGGNQSVRNVMDQISGIKPPVEQKRGAILNIVRAANLGTLTGLRDFTANFTLGMQHQQNPIQTITTGLKALTNLKQYIADGIETGRIRHNINELEWSDTIGGLRRVADVISDSQGRNFLEKITRGTSMGMGQLTTLQFHEQYIKGNMSSAAKDWFNNFAEGVNWQKPTLSRDEVLKIASRFVDSAQGTYDPRGLPNFAVSGSWAPIFSLARWNIEKANNYNKNVIKPLTQGNIRPFLMSTLGMVIGGEAVNKLTEELTGRKEKTAKKEELEEAYKEGQNITPALMYKALGLASASGYAGIMSDVAKNIMDKMYAKTKPRWYNNMLLEGISKVSSTTENFVQGISEDGLRADTLIDYVSQVVSDNLQMYRLIMGHVGEDTKKQIDQSNKTRDLRNYKLLHKEDVSDLSDSDFSPKFEDKAIKDFKKEENPLEAAKMVPDLIKDALDKAGNDPEKLRKELEKIKKNSYQTMPSPDDMPYSFLKYLTFLKKTQGEEEANKRLMDYMKRNTVNEIKSEMIP